MSLVDIKLRLTQVSNNIEISSHLLSQNLRAQFRASSINIFIDNSRVVNSISIFHPLVQNLF